MCQSWQAAAFIFLSDKSRLASISPSSLCYEDFPGEDASASVGRNLFVCCVCRVQINQNAQRFMAKMANCFLNCLKEEAWRLKVITVEAVLPADGGATREGRMGLELEPGLIIEC